MSRPEYDTTVGAKSVYGHDGENYQAIRTDQSGSLIISSDISSDLIDLASSILVELRMITFLLNEGLNVKVDLEEVRNDQELTLEEEM